jgi:membrane-associated phospholipid phosphatase
MTRVEVNAAGGSSRSGLHAIAFSFLFLGTAILGRYPDWFDRPVARAINSFTRDHPFANGLAALVAYPTLEGAVVVSLVWCCWFSRIKAEPRARLVSGVFAAVLAGVIAHLMLHMLPPMPKPIFDPILALHPPDVLGDIDVLRATSFPNSPTFPSERATMFAGLAIAVFLIRYKLGFLALGCTTVVELSRIYLGLHYPTDIMGSFSLAAAILWFAQIRWGSVLGLRFVRWEGASASTFYMCAFFVSYQITTAFQDLRELTAQFFR